MASPPAAGFYQPQHLQPANASPYSQRESELNGPNNDQWSDEDSEDDGGDGSRKRKRPMSVSCELCKARKVKCDRGQPACGWCVKNKQFCEYKERKKPGLRAGYGRELEARLDRLEAVLRAQGHSINHLLAQNGSPSQSVHSPPISAPLPEANMFANPATIAHNHYAQVEPGGLPQQTPFHNPQTPAGMMAGDTQGAYNSGFNDGNYPQTSSSTTHTTNNHNQYPGHDPSMQQDSKSFFSNGAASNAVSSSMGMTKSPSALQEGGLPPYDLLYSLADLYFKHINTWCPILHRKSTFDALFGPSSLEEADRMILHAMVATTLRYSTDARLTPEVREAYHAASKQKVLLYGLEHSSVKALQAMVILALDLCGESNGPPGWNLLAMIARSAVQLGLSVEATSCAVSPSIPSIYTLRAMVLPEPTSWVEDESRRRLFWMIYVLDRYSTITTAFDFALDEKEIDRRLPCRDDLFSMNRASETKWFRPNGRTDGANGNTDHMGSFSYYVEVMTILTQIHHFLKKPIDIGRIADVERWQREYRELNTYLNKWKDHVPPEVSDVANNKTNAGCVMLQATYHTTVMRLHSSAAYPARRSQLFTPSFKASQLCMSAVDSISILCTHLKAQSMLSKLGPPFAFSVWVAARLLLVHSSTIDKVTNPRVQGFIDILRELGTYWSVADRYATLLQRVLDEFADSEQHPVTSPDGERNQPCSVKILADMRRNAHDLDVLISRQPKPLSAAGQREQALKTLAPNELDYLDVFDFFNMPRVANSNGGTPSNVAMMHGQAQGYGFPGVGNGGEEQAYDPATWGWDVNADWFTGGTPT